MLSQYKDGSWDIYTLGDFLEPKSSGDLPPENNFPSDMATSRDDIRPEGKLICRIQNTSTGEKET